MSYDLILRAVLETLIALSEQSQHQGEVLVGALLEVSALRASVEGLDPTFPDVLHEKRRLAHQEAPELIARIEKLTRANVELREQLECMKNKLSAL
jgi:hypothetical protein